MNPLSWFMIWLAFPNKCIITLAACLLDAEERSNHMSFDRNKGTATCYTGGKQQHEQTPEKSVAFLLESVLHLLINYITLDLSLFSYAVLFFSTGMDTSSPGLL